MAQESATEIRAEINCSQRVLCSVYVRFFCSHNQMSILYDTKGHNLPEGGSGGNDVLLHGRSFTFSAFHSTKWDEGTPCPCLRRGWRKQAPAHQIAWLIEVLTFYLLWTLTAGWNCNRTICHLWFGTSARPLWRTPNGAADQLRSNRASERYSRGARSTILRGVRRQWTTLVHVRLITVASVVKFISCIIL